MNPKSKIQNPKSKGRLRWGILGTSRIADVQARAIRMSGNSELRAVASRDLGIAQAWARERTVPLAFGSYEELLRSDEIDAVYIPLPNSLHKEWSVRAAQNGKHVLCEKPLATGPAEVLEMMEAAEAHGVKLMEAFMYRFHPQIEAVRRLLAEGAIGDFKIVRATFGFYLPAAGIGDAGRPDPRSPVPDPRKPDIRWMKELGGGALMDVGCYCVNLARLVAGAEPVAASASAVWAPGGVDESLAGTLEFPGGVLAVIDCSFQTGPGTHQSLDISGTRGRIRLAEPFRVGEEPVTVLLDRGGGQQADHERSEGTQLQTPGANEFQLMIEHFANAVLNNTPLNYPPQDSLGNIRAMSALHESARTGKRQANFEF